MRDDVLKQIKRTKTCNGGLVAEVREWITEVELCIPILGYVQGAVLEVAAGTARGPLRKELERFVGEQVQLQGAGGAGRAGAAWNVVRDHLRAVFLTQNEAEQLRAEVETLKMNLHDTVATHNLRFREAAAATYPVPRSADAERVLVHAYIRSLFDYDIKRKVIEHHPANLNAAMNRAEQVADKDQCRRLLGDRREEPMELGSVRNQGGATNMLETVTKRLENLTTEIGKLKTQAKQKTRYRTKKQKLD